MVTRSLEPRKPASCQVAPCGGGQQVGQPGDDAVAMLGGVRACPSDGIMQWNLTTSRLSAVGTRGYAIEQVAVHHGAMPIG